MKRVFALLLALAMVMSLGITAFATETSATPTKGSITITNATVGHTYELYKIFDATYNADSADQNNDGVKDQVSYSISETVKDEDGEDVPNPIFEYMFGGIAESDIKGTTVINNDYFTYYPETGLITRRTDVENKDSDMFAYLAAMVRALEAELKEEQEQEGQEGQEKHLYLDAKVAEDKTVAFNGLDFGYYLIDKSFDDNNDGIDDADGTDVAVTITSNTPTINVIDKNQKPASGFSKLVWDEKNQKWVSSNTANIGDIIDFKVEFDTTNYDGEGKVLYYNVLDSKTSSLWIEFDEIEVNVTYKVDGELQTIPLTKGYYHGTEGEHSEGDEWEYLGTGWNRDENGNVIGNPDPNEAQWYLIHYGYDDIEIVIPWLKDHTFTGKQSATDGYKIAYPMNKATGEVVSDSLYPSPASVVITYSAAVGPDAAGMTSENSATLDWKTDKADPIPGTPSTTTTTVYNLGITKISAGDTNSRLSGAVFELYREYDAVNKTYDKPVYVIPTNNPGVYILDDIATDISGYKRVTSREMYKDYWETWMEAATKTVNVDGVDIPVRNDVETPVSGQIVVLGLEAGTYYLKETKAPEGYNLLPGAAIVEVGGADIATYSNGYKTLPSENHPEGVAVEYIVNSKIVENNKGVQLPSTGGKGTMMLITFGTMVAVAFAVLMITQKKMSIYND